MTSHDTQQQEHQDILHYKPSILKVIDDERTLKLLADPHYYAVITVLREGPMTVREIEKAFNELAEKSDKIENKSDKTIYRYLKTLEEVGIVVPGGQRVIIGKTATEKLFMRTAYVFERKDIEWLSEKGDIWAQRFALMVGTMVNGDQEPSIPCIQAFFDRWSDAKTAALEKLAKEAADEISELFKFEEWRLLQEFIDRVYLFGTLMNDPSLLDELRRCFQLS